MMATETKTKKRIRVTLEYDPDLENPAEMDCQWRVVSFNRRHMAFEDPGKFGITGVDRHGEPIIENIGLRRKLAVGTAFVLSYYEHGLCRWDISGTRNYPDAQWDSCPIAGLLLWEHPANHLGPKTYADRQKDAEGFLANYTDWCNGSGYYYRIELVTYEADESGELTDKDGSWSEADCEEIEAVGGWFDSDEEYMKDEIRSSIRRAGYDPDGKDIEIAGEAAACFSLQRRKSA